MTKRMINCRHANATTVPTCPASRVTRGASRSAGRPRVFCADCAECRPRNTGLLVPEHYCALTGAQVLCGGHAHDDSDISELIANRRDPNRRIPSTVLQDDNGTNHCPRTLCSDGWPSLAAARAIGSVLLLMEGRGTLARCLAYYTSEERIRLLVAREEELAERERDRFRAPEDRGMQVTIARARQGARR